MSRPLVVLKRDFLDLINIDIEIITAIVLFVLIAPAMILYFWATR